VWLGSCDVSIPRDHRLATLETPALTHFEFRADPDHHIVLLKMQQETYEQFYNQVSARVRQSERKEAFVFIHGYRVTFEDAVRRTAQLAYDLTFDGAPIVYTWPSFGALAKYPADEAVVEWTVPHLRWLLEDLAKKIGATTIHLIAHSMGNRAMTGALRSMSVEKRSTLPPHFKEIVMAAPDIDAGVFKQIADSIHSSADRITLYASSKDEALLASKEFHGAPRAGEGGKNIVVVPGVDTIDASAVATDLIKHSYFADSTSVVADIFNLIKNELPPTKRFGLFPSVDQRYWVFHPTGR